MKIVRINRVPNGNGLTYYSTNCYIFIGPFNGEATYVVPRLFTGG